MSNPVEPTLLDALWDGFVDMNKEMSKDSSEFTPPTNEVRNWYMDDFGPDDEFICEECHGKGPGPSYDGMCRDCAGMTTE